MTYDIVYSFLEPARLLPDLGPVPGNSPLSAASLVHPMPGVNTPSPLAGTSGQVDIFLRPEDNLGTTARTDAEGS